MMISNSAYLLSALLVLTSVDALYTPRRHHAAHARHAVHVRAPQPVAEPIPVPIPVAEPLAQPSAGRRRSRRANKTCKQRPMSAAPAAPSAAPAAPVNVGSDPSSQTPKAAPSPKASPKPVVEQPEPQPEPQPKPQPKPSSAPAPSDPAPSEGGARPFGDFFAGVNKGGDGTFYTPGLGACGWTNGPDELVAAVPYGLWGSVPGFHSSNPNDNPVCGHFLTVTYNGKSVRVKVVDECMGCNIKTSIDMSPAAFDKLADESIGRIHDIEWQWDS